MAADISPMSPVSSTPVVREKRHYPNEEKEKNLKNQKQDDRPEGDEQLKEESDDDAQQKDMKADEKNVRVGHIDEYV